MRNINFVLLLGVAFSIYQASAQACEKVGAVSKPKAKLTAQTKDKKPVIASKPVAKKPPSVVKPVAKAAKPAPIESSKKIQAKGPATATGRKPAQVKPDAKKKLAAKSTDKPSKKIAKEPPVQKGFHFIPLPPKKKIAMNDQRRTTSSVSHARVVSYFKKDRVAIKPDGDVDASEVSARLVPTLNRTKVGTKHSVRDEE